MIRLFRDRPHRRGQTIVEFALILPIFILVLVGIVDFGRAVYASSTIQNAARQAVRVAIVDQNVTVIETEAIEHAVALGIDGADVDVNFLDDDYTSGPCSTTPDVGCIVEVEVRYTYNAATPILGNIVGTINMSGSSRQPIESQNASAP
jgi:Flp pilus assembly protein TadG